MSLSRRKALCPGGHPGVRAVLTQPAGQGNLLQAAVKLPLSLALDPENAEVLCDYAEGQKDDPQCPQGSIVGRAIARTPILDRPLTGPVYFTRHVRMTASGRQVRTLPALTIPLRGGVALNLRATSSVRRGGKLVATFAGVPDAPVSRFELRLDGGRNGILAVNGRPCRRPKRQIADVELDGHNGKRADRGVRITLPCRKAR